MFSLVNSVGVLLLLLIMVSNEYWINNFLLPSIKDLYDAWLDCPARYLFWSCIESAVAVFTVHSTLSKRILNILFLHFNVVLCFRFSAVIICLARLPLLLLLSLILFYFRIFVFIHRHRAFPARIRVCISLIFNS